MSRAVVFDKYGPPDVLRVVDVEPPDPGRDRLRVRVRAAGVQPFDVKQRRGDTADWAPARFPQGGGSEFAGVVDAVGPDVPGLAVGDEVIGWAVGPAHAEYALATDTTVVVKPAEMPWAEAGAITASGQTAHTSLEALQVATGDTVLIHAAAGGVGTAAVQIARARGARVIGTASQANHDYLRELGAEPVTYGAGLADRVREIAPGGVTAVLDAVGTAEALRASLDVVTDIERVGTIAGQDLADDFGVRVLGTERSTARLAELVRLHTDGQLRVHVQATYPLEEIAAAHREVEAGHVRGKIVILP